MPPYRQHHLGFSNSDEFVKSRKTPFFVIPAEAGIQSNRGIWTPAFAGVTALGTFYEAVNSNCPKTHFLGPTNMTPII